jgi:site-specific DNA-cytosine methylase
MAYLKNTEIVMISKSNHLKTLLSKIDITQTQSLDTYNQSTHKDFIQTIRANINSRNEDFLCKDGVIRKYTEKECWRFMGFEDIDINKAILAGVPNSQLYKQAGNSIVVNVLMAIFKQML